jgi:hypothetical protein
MLASDRLVHSCLLTMTKSVGWADSDVEGNRILSGRGAQNPYCCGVADITGAWLLQDSCAPPRGRM